jgi:3-oxoacyl-[acyl-carrier protein] reductase
MDLGLKNKTALIAGASAGIGAAAARALAGEGARLALASRGGDALAALTAELQGAGVDAFAVHADLTAPADADKAVKAALDRFGRIDVLVISIGAAQGGLFWELDDAVWEQAFALKFMGMIRLLRAAAPVMKAQGSGSIIVVVGNNGRQPQARLGPGSAVNAACLAVVKALGDELAPHGVQVNAVNPGPTRTGRWDNLMRNLSATSGRAAAEEEAAQMAMIPAGRINEPEEIGRLIAMLASGLTGAMNGTSVTVDGGATRSLA